MDVATLVGILAGLGMVAGAIAMGGDFFLFVDGPSLLIVVGGTIATTLVTTKINVVMGAFKVARNAFSVRDTDITHTIASILDLSAVARREGVLALDKQVLRDPFLARGVRMAVDGLPQDEIRETLTAELVAMKERHNRGQKLFRFMASTSPAMGMIGTLLGLVQMLRLMTDPAKIGPAMAVALLTTFYGAVMAFMVFTPIAEKLERRTKEEAANMIVVIEGIDSIVKGYNSIIIREKLEARLAPNERSPEEGT